MGDSARPSTSTGPNNFQNFPVISSAGTGSRVTTVRVTLEGIPTQGIAQGCIIRFFKNPRAPEMKARSPWESESRPTATATA